MGQPPHCRCGLALAFMLSLGLLAPATAADQAPYDRMDANTALVVTTLAALPTGTAEAWWQSAASLLPFPLPAMADTGLKVTGHWAIHTLGSWPVAHWPVQDQTKLTQWLDTLPGFSQRTIGSTQFEWRPTPTWMANSGIAIHHDEHWLSVAWVADEAHLLRRVTHLDRPERAFNPQSLYDRIEDTEFDGHVVARLQPERLANRWPEPLCQGELARLAAAWPELLVGTTEAGPDRATLKWLATVAPALAEPLQRLGGGHPSLEPDHPELQGHSASIGLAADVTASRDAGLALAQFWLAHDWQCRALATHTPTMQRLQQLLNRPIPPLFTALYGARLRLDQVEPLDASAAVYLHNPSFVIGLMQLLSPPLAALDLRPSGSPQRLPHDTIPGLPERPIALYSSDLALAIGLGDAAIDRLPDAVRSRRGDPTLLRLRLRDQTWMQALMRLPATSRPMNPDLWQDLWPWTDVDAALSVEENQIVLRTALAWPSPTRPYPRAKNATE